MRSFRIHILAAMLIGWGVPGFSQMGFELKLEKPKEYEERILRGEKTSDKRIKFPQRILQNTVTRYNYFFNASNKLNEVLTRAKQAFQDDFTKLLPFYNYTLEKTAQDGVQLDSIIWKSNSGIVLHDLRNDWNDDLYLLWGAAYYFQQNSIPLESCSSSSIRPTLLAKKTDTRAPSAARAMATMRSAFPRPRKKGSRVRCCPTVPLVATTPSCGRSEISLPKTNWPKPPV